MEIKSTLIADFLILLILFCESCGRQVKLGDNHVRFPEESQGSLDRRIQSYNWYTTQPTVNSFSNGNLPYTNQNQGSYYSWMFPNAYAPASSYLDYFRTDRQEPYDPWLYGDLYSEVESTMSNYGHPHQASHYGYSDHYGKAELLKINKKGFLLLGLFSLMTILQNLFQTIVNLFTTTTTTTTSATSATGNRSIRSISRFPVFDEVDDRSKRIMHLVLPSLNTITHIRSGLIPVTCTLHELCVMDRILKEELPGKGDTLGDELFDKIQEFLEEDGRHRGYLRMHLGSFNRARQRSHLDCASIFPICPKMRRLHTRTIQRPAPLATVDEFFSHYKSFHNEF